ncbi:hypothetical protein NMG60_11028010 [Bertholletia excelsa]
MASISSFHSSVRLRCLSFSHKKRSLVTHLRAHQMLPCHPSPCPVVAFSGRRGNSSSAITSSKKKKQGMPPNDINEEHDLDEDALEKLFSQLEEDLRNGDPSLDDDDDELSEEDLKKLEHELGAALEEDELLGTLASLEDDDNNNHSKEEEEEEEEDDDDNADDDDIEQPVKLKNWQLKRLAYALKDGRRKTRIKNLAADVCLDRAVVLQLLRDPPPNLLLMSAALPDKPPAISEAESKPQETVSSGIVADVAEPQAKVKVPVHVMHSSWSAQKRLKKVQVETLERVYSRTKRPTNAMVSSIVHVTNLPRKRVVKWFEDNVLKKGFPITANHTDTLLKHCSTIKSK